MVVDPIILGEIRFGIHLLPVGKRRTRLERWFRQVSAEYYALVGMLRLGCVGPNFLPIFEQTAKRFLSKTA